MKNIKKVLVLAMCIGVLGSMTGCGNSDKAADGADRGITNTTMDGENHTNDADGKKDAAKDDYRAGDKTEYNQTDKNGAGMIDNAVHDVTDGIDQITDDLTGNEHRTEDGTDNASRENTKGTENSEYKER